MAAIEIVSPANVVFPLTLGQPLPTIPLWLSPDLHIELPLEPSDQETCRLLRIA